MSLDQIATFIDLYLQDDDWNHFRIGADWADENGYPHAAEWLRWMAARKSKPHHHIQSSAWYWWMDLPGAATEEKGVEEHWMPLPLEKDRNFPDHSFSVDYLTQTEAYLIALKCAESERSLPPWNN